MIQGVVMLSPEQTFDGRDEWRFLAEELSLLSGMTDTGGLGFAIQLKFRRVRKATGNADAENHLVKIIS